MINAVRLKKQNNMFAIVWLPSAIDTKIMGQVFGLTKKPHQNYNICTEIYQDGVGLHS